MQFVVYFEVVVNVEDEVPEDIHDEAMILLSQGIGSFEYEPVNDNYPRPD